MGTISKLRHVSGPIRVFEELLPGCRRRCEPGQAFAVLRTKPFGTSFAECVLFRESDYPDKCSSYTYEKKSEDRSSDCPDSDCPPVGPPDDDVIRLQNSGAVWPQIQTELGTHCISMRRLKTINPTRPCTRVDFAN